MHLIDTDGATVNNRFTEGDAQLSIPATVVGEIIANAWQLELSNLIVLGANIPLLLSGTDTFDQLIPAIRKMIQKGGTINPTEFVIANNVGAPADVTGVVFDKADVKSVKMNFDIHRRTDTQHVNEAGAIWLVYDPEDDDWKISVSSFLDDAGLVFSVTAAGQLQYTSTDLTGATYSGTLRVSQLEKIEFTVALLPAP